MSVSIGQLKGITTEVVAALKAQKIDNSQELLDAAKTPQNRKALASAAGVETSVILELANRADLARINGIGAVYSDLFEEAGVDTVKELARRSPENLFAKLTEINEAKQISKRALSLTEITDFIDQAKALPGALEY